MKNLILATFLLIVTITENHALIQKKEKPKICFSFDDGNISNQPGYKSEQWNLLLLDKLQQNKVQAIFFALGNALNNEKGKTVIQTWSDRGHLIGNHTYSHNSYNSPASTFENFRADFLKNDSLIETYKGYTKFFRFPYLKEGNTKEKRDLFRTFLKEKGYSNGYVTVDASDWFINDRLIKRLKENPKTDIQAYKQFYLQHIWERTLFYNDLALKLTGRQISHTLLLHHNLASALFIDDLVKMFQIKGWDVVDASVAYKDKIYTTMPDIVPAGQSLIWAMAKENGAYEHILRDPAEDSKYEEPTMNKLGL